jgi:hypothetical protein
MSEVVGVSHALGGEEESVPFVVRADAARWKYERPCGVSFFLKVNL